MSEAYNAYLQNHKENIIKAFTWLRLNLPEIVKGVDDWAIHFCHDASKAEDSEYTAYDAYFYGGNRSHEVVQNYQKAWLTHIHRNQHHWQHWVLINDDPDEGIIALDIPYDYIIEMICDWWSFSWSKGNLSEIFAWYEERKNHIILSDKTRTKVEDILGKIKDKVSKEEQVNEAKV